ncbi:hypothetical protein [Leptothermofonsia sp. ETS-13]|uniref:hypothetical protein n=1 Tax=Leptothermofonsia sp. ETS-13 TaxID=3035696 RepID=UPI003BA39A2F
MNWSNKRLVARISGRPVGRLLAEAELKPYQSPYWLHPRPGLCHQSPRHLPGLRMRLRGPNVGR